ncbi:MAG: hypothetical protein ACREPX_02435 [Rhodanobacteraceae bacterium]
MQKDGEPIRKPEDFLSINAIALRSDDNKMVFEAILSNLHGDP